MKCSTVKCSLQVAGGNMYENEKMADLILKILNIKYFAEHKADTYFECIT